MANQKKAEESDIKWTKTISIIGDMVKNNEKINYYTVSKKANVSRKFLYRWSEISNLIKENRKEKVKIVDDEDMIIYINKLLLRKKNVEKKLEYYEKNYPDIDLYTAIVELYEEEKRNQTPN